jgi:hypothetical protein
VAQAAILVAVLAAASAYETAVALGWVELGREPGAGPAGGDVVLVAALLALLAGVVHCWRRAVRGGGVAGLPEALLGPAAVAFVAARFYSYDPYYLPTLRRMSDDGVVADRWILLLVVLAVLAALVTRLRPRAGLGATATLLFVSALTAFWEDAGH